MDDGSAGRSPWKSLDLVLAACCIVLAVTMFWGSRDYPDLPWSVGGSPKFFPQVLSVVLAALAVGVMIEAWRRATPFTRPRPETVLRMAAGLAAFAVAPWLLDIVGFRLAAILIGLSVMVVMTGSANLTRRNVAIMIVVAVGTSVTLHFAFEGLAGRRLPDGILFG